MISPVYIIRTYRPLARHPDRLGSGGAGLPDSLSGG